MYKNNPQSTKHEMIQVKIERKLKRNFWRQYKHLRVRVNNYNGYENSAIYLFISAIRAAKAQVILTLL